MTEYAPHLDTNTIVNFGLLAMLLAVLVAIVRTRSLLAAVLLMGIYSLISAVWFVVLDAADVAFTEAVVGAGVSTAFLLGAILLTRTESLTKRWQDMVMPGLVCVGAGALLFYAALDLPLFGDPSAPANAHVGRFYIEETKNDVGVPNIVTAVLASYRGFDTLGETIVVFAGGIGVALMLGFGERSMGDLPPALRSPVMEALAESDHHVVLRSVAKLLIPIIALYAFYVQFHGEVGAGGGFQAGVIFAVAVILHALIFGLADTMDAIPPELARAFAALGVLLYSGVGVINMINGGNFLDYDHLFPLAFEAGLPGSHLSGGYHHWGQHFGIIIIELGVLFTVAATMIAMFYAFAGRAADVVGEGARG